MGVKERKERISLLCDPDHDIKRETHAPTLSNHGTTLVDNE